MLPNPRPAPSPSPSSRPSAHHQSRRTPQHHTAPRVSCVLPGRGSGPRQGELWCWCAELCGVVWCYGGVAAKINCVVLCDVSRQLIAAGPHRQSLVYSLQPGSGSGGGSSHTGHWSHPPRLHVAARPRPHTDLGTWRTRTKTRLRPRPRLRRSWQWHRCPQLASCLLIRGASRSQLRGPEQLQQRGTRGPETPR